MQIKVTSEDELKEIAATLLHYSYNCRYWQQLWAEHHGGELLAAKRKWEKKLDDYLKQLGMEKTDKLHEVHISIKNENSQTQ